jgi:IstB-like ATP binding protein
MSATAVTREIIVAQTRALKMPGVARVFESLARQARDAHWPHEDYLHEVLTAEQTSRHESVIRPRLREARFPRSRRSIPLISPPPRASARRRSMLSHAASGSPRPRT